MKYEAGLQKDRAEKKSLIIEHLHSLQDANPKQFLSEDDLKKCAKEFNLTMAEVYGIASYYSMFSLKPRGKYIIRLCKSSVCHMMGAENMASKIESLCKTKFGNTSANDLFTLEYAECLGQCEKAPAMMINKNVHGSLNPESLEKIIENLKKENA
ncbi:MAG: NAD(P)H-dependent oxidoreductase subunit E [Bacteroidales bacterium]|nr:NAD(P)H-dependent oxidoreductase subunit E [Bacteroidales bacterium]